MKKENRVFIRVTELEKEAFERAAEISGVGLSAWARQKLRAAAIKELQNIGEKVVFLNPPDKMKNEG